MAQRRHSPSLEVREAFETTRFSPQCLIDAYTRLVPIRRKTVPEPGTTAQGRPPRRAGAEVSMAEVALYARCLIACSVSSHRLQPLS